MEAENFAFNVKVVKVVSCKELFQSCFFHVAFSCFIFAKLSKRLFFISRF